VTFDLHRISDFWHKPRKYKVKVHKGFPGLLLGSALFMARAVVAGHVTISPLNEFFLARLTSVFRGGSQDLRQSLTRTLRANFRSRQKTKMSPHAGGTLGARWPPAVAAMFPLAST